MKAGVADSPCPCGRRDLKSRPARYGDCCSPYLETAAAVPTAEHLMRSRYSAFVLERQAYLLATWHASTRPADVAFDPGVKWLGLEVRKHRLLDADHAEVEFVARHKPPGGAAVRLHETSRFVREDGRWYYVDGKFD